MSMNEQTGATAGQATETATDDGVEASDVRSALTKAFDEAEAAETETATTETPTTATTPGGGAAETATTSTEATTAIEGAGTTTGTAAAAASTTDKPLVPPASWSIEAKAKFATLDPIAQKEVLKREDDFHKGIEGYKTDAQAHRDMQRVIQPYLPMIQAAGGKPQDVVAEMLNAAYQLQQNPEKFIRGMAAKYNVSLAAPANGEQPAVDPVVQELRDRLARFESTITEGQRAQQQELQRAADTQLAQFAADPKNVYFADVRASMASLIQSGEAKDIQDAYDKACWMNPQVREARLQTENAEREKQRIEAAKRKAADAKRAALDVSGSGATSSGRSEKSLRDALEEAFPQ